MNEIRIAEADYRRLRDHLLREDRDEHGAVLLAGERATSGGTLLTVREVHALAESEFPPGHHGYRQFAPEVLARLGNRAAAENLSLITAHSHPAAGTTNRLSADDRDAHERVFPHLLDITASETVAGIALGQASVAGEIWHRGGPEPLERMTVVGANRQQLTSQPRTTSKAIEERYDRQVRLFGEIGQERLGELRVAVVGAGGGGSILVEQLAHLGVGHLTVIDHDVVKRHNLSRIIGADEKDARRATKKVDVARRVVERIGSGTRIDAIDGDIADLPVAERLLEVDFILLATDTATARLVANAIAQTFLVPLIQIGAKVDARADGTIEQIYTAVRPVLPRQGCLSCAGLVDPVLLQREAANPEERKNQNYLGEVEVVDPSVTTLNAAAAADALNTLLMSVIGQASSGLLAHRISLTREGRVLCLDPQRDVDCRWCGDHQGSRFARADVSLLPCRASQSQRADKSGPSRLVRLKRAAARFLRIN